MKVIIGIDPGNSGGIAILNGDGTYLAMRAFSSLTEQDIWAWLYNQESAWCRSITPEHPVARARHAYIEDVHAMPKQGVSSTFKFGMSYGLLRGILTALLIPFETVRPQVWQKAMGCLSKGDKRVTKAKAQQLFPELPVTHAVADALLIAEYGRRLRMSQE